MRLHATVVIATFALAGCAETTMGSGDAARDATDVVVPNDTPDLDAAALDETLTPDFLPDADAIAMPMLTVGGTARVTATALNLRMGPTIMDTIITAMPCGSQVSVLGGPNAGWWNVRYQTDTGWASGRYLVPDSAFDPSVCTGASDGGTNSDAGSTTVAQIFSLAQSAVGYSYYWGHGSWRGDGTMLGSCSGSCPSCTHSGVYGADCSGFVAKVWQIPSPSPITEDLHPYSTWNFYNETTHWTAVPRASIQPGDALVYNASGSGHIMLFESGSDPWGNIWTYEARGCSTGIVHNLRVAASTYIAIRRNGL